MARRDINENVSLEGGDGVDGNRRTCPDQRESCGIREGGERQSGGIGALKASGEIPGRTRPLPSCYQARSDTVTNNSAYLPQRRNLLRKGYAPTEPLLPAAGTVYQLITIHRSPSTRSTNFAPTDTCPIKTRSLHPRCNAAHNRHP